MARKSTGWHIVGGDGIKASILWDEETDAWTYYSNSPFDRAPQLYRTIPTLYRGIQIISDSVTKVPFALYRGDEQIDTSASWDDTTGYMPNPRRFLKLTSQALDRHGRAYWLKLRNRGKIVKGLKWFEPQSITPKFNETTGELESFERAGPKGVKITYAPEDILYFWLDDADVEIGPPVSYPCKAALQSAGVLHNLDEFINAYFKSGAIRPVMLMAKGFPPPDEKERIEGWFASMMAGLKNARRAKVFSADSLEPKTIGDGLDQLQNQELTDDQRKDVALALGIPQTILFANSANYATSQSDWLNFHETCIIPRCEFIAETINDQLFKAEGLELRFEPEGLDIYREDENQRSAALGQLTGAGVPLLMAMDLLGYDLTPEQRAELEA
jgi:HK97 family phage portal protein